MKALEGHERIRGPGTREIGKTEDYYGVEIPPIVSTIESLIVKDRRLQSDLAGATVGAVFTPAEVFRWFTARTLQGLTAAELEDVVTTLIAAEADGRSTYETAQRLEPVLLHAAYEWPTLQHWRARFKDAGTRPDWLPLFDPRHG